MVATPVQTNATYLNTATNLQYVFACLVSPPRNGIILLSNSRMVRKQNAHHATINMAFSGSRPVNQPAAACSRSTIAAGVEGGGGLATHTYTPANSGQTGVVQAEIRWSTRD